jgi:hypothetical protein
MRGRWEGRRVRWRKRRREKRSGAGEGNRKSVRGDVMRMKVEITMVGEGRAGRGERAGKTKI